MKLADGETLIEKTYARAKALGSEVLTVTNRDYYFMSRDEKERVGVVGNFLLEPFGRNTARHHSSLNNMTPEEFSQTVKQGQKMTFSQ